MFLYKYLTHRKNKQSCTKTSLSLHNTIKLNPSLPAATSPEKFFQDINRHANLSDIVNFKPSELYQSELNSFSPVLHPRKIPKRPHLICLLRSKVLNQGELDLSYLCKKHIKYASTFALASYHLKTNSSDSAPHKKKIFTHLKNLKFCPTFLLIEGDLLPFTSKDVLHVRRSSLKIIKTVRKGQWGGHLKAFNKYRTLRSLHGSSVKEMRLPLSAEKLNFKHFFNTEKSGRIAVRQLNRTSKLTSFSLNSENLTNVWTFQRELSTALKRQINLKEISLNCYSKQETDDRHILKNIDRTSTLWTQITDLNIYNFSESFTIQFLLDNYTIFQSLRSLNYGEVRSNYEKFPAFLKLKNLSTLKRLTLSVTLPDSLNEEEIGMELLHSFSFPKDLEYLSLTITCTKPWKFLKQDTQRTNDFLSVISQLESLTSFSLNISTYTFIDLGKQDERDIVASFLFLDDIIESLPKKLEDLTFSLFQPVLMSSVPLVNDKLLFTISSHLKNLKMLTLNFLGINLTPRELERPLLPKLKSLVLYNLSLPFSLPSYLEATHIEEFSCWVTGNAELESVLLFFREINFLTSLRSLHVQFTKLNYPRLTHMLLLEIAKVFLNFRDLEDLSLGITSIAVEKEWGEWFLQLCRYKKGLKFCSIKFKNYHIVKEYFSVSLKDG